MADILIRGMDKPGSCRECDFCEVQNINFEILCFCNRNDRFLDDEEACNIPNDCPIIELPPHGDLIDLDALKHKFCAHCDGYEYDTDACVDGDQDCMDAKIVIAAPVIIPANKEETE